MGVPATVLSRPWKPYLREGNPSVRRLTCVGLERQLDPIHRGTKDGLLALLEPHDVCSVGGGVVQDGVVCGVGGPSHWSYAAEQGLRNHAAGQEQHHVKHTHLVYREIP